MRPTLQKCQLQQERLLEGETLPGRVALRQAFGPMDLCVGRCAGGETLFCQHSFRNELRKSLFVGARHDQRHHVADLLVGELGGRRVDRDGPRVGVFCRLQKRVFRVRQFQVVLVVASPCR